MKIQKITLKEKILNYKDSDDDYRKRNDMGCLKAWYNPYFAIRHSFSNEEIETMSDDEIYNLITLAESIEDGLT